MANEVSLFKSGVPDYLKTKELDDVTKSLLGGGSQSKQISIRGNMFRLVVNGKEVAVREERSMNVVIVNVAPKVSRTFYAGVYKEGVKVSPTCWSADGERPDPSSANVQSDLCANCPQNVKGSGQNQTRACKHNRRIAVLLDNDLEGDLFSMSIPAQSLFGKAENGNMPLNAYAQFLAGFNVNVTAVVTEMKFDVNSTSPKLFFKAVRPLTEEEYETVVGRSASQEAQDAVAVSFAPAKESDGEDQPEVAAAVTVGPVAAKAQTAEAPAEPKKRESKKETAPAPKKDLSKVLQEWDDEE